jgi:hypothetical protein
MLPMSTLAAALVSSWLAQAEPAPVEPAAPAPAAPGPAEPAPAAPGAPLEPVDPEPPARPNAMTVAARLATRLGADAKALGPVTGFSLGVTYQRRYLVVAEHLGLGVDVDFFYDHFAADFQTAQPIEPGIASPPDAQRTVSQTSFAALQTLSFDAAPAVAWIGAGVGLTIASFATPEPALQPGSLTAVQPLARAALGVDITVAPRTAVGLRADFTHPLTTPTLTTTRGDTLRPFGDLFDVGLGLLYRF